MKIEDLYMSNEEHGQKEGLKAKIKSRRKRAKDKDYKAGLELRDK